MAQELEQSRRAKPYLDLVLTHMDDRFDTSMRDASAPTPRACSRCSIPTASLF